MGGVRVVTWISHHLLLLPFFFFLFFFLRLFLFLILPPNRSIYMTSHHAANRSVSPVNLALVAGGNPVLNLCILAFLTLTAESADTHQACT